MDSRVPLNDGEAHTHSAPQTAANPPLAVGLGWASGTIGVIIVSSVINALILKFGVDNLGLSAAVAGVIITVTRLFDAALDPFMGSISDRTRSRWGRRRPYLLIGGILCAITPILVFSDPFSFALDYTVVYFTLGLMFFSVAYTVFNVPHLTMSYELTETPRQRTMLMSFRVYALGIGAVVGTMLGPWILTHYGGGLRGYAAMGWGLSVIILFTCLISFFATKNARVITVPAAADKPNIWQAFNAIHNRPFVSLITAKAFYLFGTGVASACYAFMITSVVQRDLTVLGLMLSAMMATLILAQPFWVWFSNRWGKRACFITAAPFNAAASFSWFFVAPGEPTWSLVLRAILIGFFGGGMALSINAMLPDTLQHEYERTGVAQEGVLAGIFTFVERTISALGVAATGAILAFGGYVSSSQVEVQATSALTAIAIATGIVPAVCIILSIALMWRYNLKD